jgi:ribulose-bisphosphate carboxylase large chain
MVSFYEGFVDLSYRPSKEDLVCSFYVEPERGLSMKMAAGAVAGESSVGTWTKLTTMTRRIARMGARVYEIRGRHVRIAYPAVLFELGNMPQILSSIAGNVFGMKAVANLRLEDVEFPRSIIHSFRGPELGCDDILKVTGSRGRPVLGTIFKPKVGMTAAEMAENAYVVYSNGITWTKDDENLGSMRFNRFEDRVVRMLDVVDRIKSEQGRTVIYAANTTGPVNDMLRRADFIKEHGGRCAMVDVLTVGWSALQALREQRLKLILHAHRAGHAAVTRNPRHGISMLVLAKIARLIGVSALHTGTAGIGKMESGEEETERANAFLRLRWHGLKAVMPIASGGLHPGLVPALIRRLGTDVIINSGGGVWGHPMGPAAGAKAMVQAVDAALEGIPLNRYAKSHPELHAALTKWGALK